MKLRYLVIVAIAIGCSQNQSKNESALIPIDTIQTGSGLQYYYLKKGEGKPIEEGSKVEAYMRLYLNDVDTVFWSTDTSEDSVFTFIQGRTTLIKGALELYPLLKEGDEVVAIMPDSIAYGKSDSRGLPGGSTLTFNPIEIKRVSKPKKLLIDTLRSVFENETVEQMMKAYNGIANSSLREKFHMSEKADLYEVLKEGNRNEELEQVALQFEAMANTMEEKRSAWYNQLYAIESRGDSTRLIQRVREIVEMDPETPYWKEVLESMENPSE
ncbi:FKBP-type peptidyl-prolyl cis-trans isomerase [Ekhidna sp.]|uniref:FKBP-type peptidyl-prolyl cis-trans isomerase n=1 Tax=Ekhidna sp. TaxID=2608089 RepID=UPI003CCBC941